MKKILIFLSVLVLLAVIFLFARNIIVKSILIKATKQITGLELKIKNVNIGLSKTDIAVFGLNVFNPPGFQQALMVDLPEIYINYDLMSFLKGQTHLEVLKLELKEFIVVKNSQGKLNVNSIKGISETGKPGLQTKKPAKKEKLKIKIDLLELKIGKVIYKDYTQVPPSVSEYSININEKYENIADVDSLVRLVVARAIINTSISKLAELDFASLKDDVSGIIGRGKDIFKNIRTPEEVGQAIQDISRQIGDIFKKSSGTSKNED